MSRRPVDDEDYPVEDVPVSDIESFSESGGEEDGEDLDQTYRDDYRYDQHLDNYDPHYLAEEEEVVEYGQHQQLLREMDQQQRRERQYTGTFGLDDFSGGDILDRSDVNLREYQFDEADMGFDLDHYQGHLREIITQPTVIAEIRKRFRHVIVDYQENGEYIYDKAINYMAGDNLTSFEVNFQHILQTEPIVAQALLDMPSEILRICNEEVNRLVNLMFPGYHQIRDSCYVRFTHLTNKRDVRELRYIDVNKFISLHGVVVRRSSVFPKIFKATYECYTCGLLMPGYQQNPIGVENKPKRCANPDCQSRAIRVNQANSQFQNFQKLTLQEAPGSVPAGRIPRQTDIIVLDDLVDHCVPGDEVEVVGVYQTIPDTRMNRQTGFAVYATTVLANNIIKHRESSFSSEITEQDIDNIRRISQWPDITNILINSIAPSIYGHRDLKTAIILSLFGGVPKQLESGQRLRGDINVLLLGDPGTAKSQFLKYTEKIAHRAVYTTGKGASAVGLTASVQRERTTGEWVLEGGALVLADKGTCLIDEFDKMSDQDRTSIHEAMEQQTISISKAGIVCTLKARCGVIAAANPIGGTYDSTQTFQDQVDLTEPILSRFDILCVVRDLANRENDERLADFVIQSHMNAIPQTVVTNTLLGDDVSMSDAPATGAGDNPANRFDPIAEDASIKLSTMRQQKMLSQTMLSKYITYAKDKVNPSLKNISNDRIVSLYKDLRRAANKSGGIQITPRHLESVVRMSEAFAKMRLSQYVTEDDVARAIAVMLDSFFQSQKLSVKNEMQQTFSQYLIQGSDRDELLLDVLRDLLKNEIQQRQLMLGVDYETAIVSPFTIGLDAFKARATRLGISDLESFHQSEVFKSVSGLTFNDRRKVYIFDLQQRG